METQVSISPDLFAIVEQVAATRGISVADFVNESLRSAVAKKAANDPFFADNAIWQGDCPSDVSANHDKYLHEESP